LKTAARHQTETQYPLSFGMTKLSPKDELKWVCNEAPLHELMDRYPEIWKRVGPQLVSTLEDGRPETLKDYSANAKSIEETWHYKIHQSRFNGKVIETAIPHLIQSRMAFLAMDRCYHAAATGKASGKIRFNLINGYIIQRLLFSHHLTRKPASLKWFHFWWRFVSQKRLLMPLVQPNGIYCFYSKELIHELCILIGDRNCLEIGAGDGTLTRFMAEQGIRIRATDDYSWSHTVKFPETVERIGARQALSNYQPQTVICSWPPPGNSFEQRVFSTRSVELYIVIGSRYRFSAGNWDSYEAQDKFAWSIDRKLSALIIPPELESAVLVFTRKPD
jgi:hypothetical protein